MKILNVNRRLLPVKVHYFLSNGAMSGVIPFLPVYAKQLGISVTTIGAIYAVLPFLTLVTNPLFGVVADFTQKLKLILLTQLCIITVTMLGINFIPLPITSTKSISSNNTNQELFCWQNNSYLISYEQNSSCLLEFEKCTVSCSLCEEESSLCLSNHTISHFNDDEPPFEINSTQQLLATCVANSSSSCHESCYNGSGKCHDVPEVNPQLQLWLFSVLVTVARISHGVSASLSDAACFNALEARPQLFGKQRMWGTVGWGLFAAFTGYLNQLATGASSVYNYSPGFYVLAGLLVMDLVAVQQLEMSGAKASKHLCKDVGPLLVKPRIVAFLIGVFFIGMFTGLYRSFLYWHLRTLKASQLVLGLASCVQCFLGELPFFFFAGWIIAKIGHINTITAAFVAYALRFIAYSYLNDPWWVLPIEILQGPCFGAFYAAMTSYAKVIAPPGTEATMQGLVSGTFEGLGSAAGSLLGSFGFDIYGGSSTFFIFSVVALVGAVLHAAAHVIKS